MGCFTLIFLLICIDDFLSAGVTELPEHDVEKELAIQEVETTEEILADLGAENLTNLNENINFTNVDLNNSSESPEAVPPWNSEASPILKAIRDFLFQARDGLLDPNLVTTEASIAPGTEQMIKIIEESIIEASTMIMQSQDLETITDETPKSSGINVFEIKKDSASDPFQNKVRLNSSPSSNKRQSVTNAAANMTTSCSNCYDRLQACVNKCFVDHNCHDVQREVRRCPPIPGRLCNPFTPWSPVDQCNEHADCKSPLLCCNDGCVKKCSPGIWRI